MVRTDKNMDAEFRENEAWGPDSTQAAAQGLSIVDGKRVAQSLSGHERNHLFMNQDGKEFRDLSLFSGIDNEADGRAFGVWDIDHDGWQDIALVNSNAPLLNIYHNQIGLQAPTHRSIAIRLRGGNLVGAPSKQWSNRDGYGAVVTVVSKAKKYVREHRCGEGFAAQNSATLIVGLAEASQADEIHVRWPSGKTQTVVDVPVGKLVTLFENPEGDRRAAGKPYALEEYQPSKLPLGPIKSRKETERDLQDFASASRETNDKYRVYVTTATWCPSCKKNQPQVALLKQALGEQIDLYGLPVDPKDTPEKLIAYREKYQPAYRLITELTEKDRKVLDELPIHKSLPSVLITNPDGKVLSYQEGVPDVSEVLQIIANDR